MLRGGGLGQQGGCSTHGGQSLRAGGARGLRVPALTWLRAVLLGALRPVAWSHQAPLRPFLTHDPPASRAAARSLPSPPWLRELRTPLTPSRCSWSRKGVARRTAVGSISVAWGDRDTPSAESHGSRVGHPSSPSLRGRPVACPFPFRAQRLCSHLWALRAPPHISRLVNVLLPAAAISPRMASSPLLKTIKFFATCCLFL